jgi:hypothetical protein
MQRSGRAAATAALALALVAPVSAGRAGIDDDGGVALRQPPAPWGALGHEMAARAAHATLPAAMPAFFRAAGGQLVYLNPEPDRWRARALAEMDQAWSYDHYIDLENVPDGALDARDRWPYLKALYDAGLTRPERDAGFLPFRIVELYQRLVTEWRLWRAEDDPTRRGWIAERIVADAGILGHYVTDASQPHHTTIHFNGWASDAPNPEGYTLDRTFHARFESDYVSMHVRDEDVARRMPARPRSVAGTARAAVLVHIQATHATVEELYRLDRDVGFDPDGPMRAEARDFAADRLAAGAAMLADLWLSAWEESAR